MTLLGERKGHFESPGRVTLPFFSGQVVYLWTLLSDEQMSNKVGVEHQPHIDTLSIRVSYIHCIYTYHMYIVMPYSHPL